MTQGPRFYKTREGAFLPKKNHKGDAGYDFITPARTRDYARAGRICQIQTGVIVDLPPGTVGLIQERSSSALNGLMTVGNVIDEGYEGEISIILLNTTDRSIRIRPESRVAQLLILQRCISPEEVGLPKRGRKGLGSTQGTLSEALR